MPGITGYWGAPDLDIFALARSLQHREAQRIQIFLDRDDRAVAHVGLPPSPAGPTADEARVTVAVDGEIYRGPAEDNPDPSDSASFLASLYARDPGLGFLSSLDGVFSAAIFDEPRRRLVLLTDPLGLGPLYFRAEPGRIVFSSEVRTFAAVGPAEINARAVNQFLARGHLTGNTAWIRNVELLGPGCSAIFSADTGEVARTEPERAPRGPAYRSLEEARGAVLDAFRASIDRRAGERCAVQLGGDLASHFVLAAAESSGRPTTTFTYGDAQTEDLVYARKACAVRNTPNYSASRLPEDWFQRQVAAIWLGEGLHLTHQSTLSVSALMARHGVEVGLNGYLGKGLLGCASLRGFSDERLDALWSRWRRAFHASVRPAQNFVRLRFPFADRDVVSAALRSDTAYLLDDRLLADTALTAYRDHFSTIPLRGADGRTAVQLLAGAPAKRDKTIVPGAHDFHNLLRADPRIEEIIRDLLFADGALYRSFADAHAAQGLFFDFFRHGDGAAREPLLRHVALEVWLRQLLRGELRELDPFPDVVSAAPKRRRPKISVIIPAFNAEPYLGECLNSLINQTLPDIEILVVNDGSTDGTQRVIDEFAATDARVRPLSTANQGVYAARNLALDVAQGDFISFVDADDYVHPEMLEALLAALTQHDADLSFCDVYQFDTSDALKVRENTLMFEAETPFNLESTPEIIHDGFTTLWNRLYKRSLFEDNHLRFDAQHRISADMLFLQRVICHSKAMVRVPRPLYYYRFATPSGLTSYEVRNAQYKTHLAITIELMDFWVREGLFKRYAAHVITKAMRNFLWNTHIDEEKLRFVFDRLHEYVSTLDVKPAALREVPEREREVFGYIRAGSFGAMMRSIGGYRANMIEQKGGSLSRWQQLSVSAVELGRAVTGGVFGLKNDRAHRRYHVSLPGVDIALGYPTVALKLDMFSQSGLATKTVAALRTLEDRARIAADVRGAVRQRKRAAELRVLHFSLAFSVPSETFTYDVLCGLEARPEIDNYMLCLRRELEGERPFAKTICLHGHERAELDEGTPAIEQALETVLSALRPDVVHCHFGWVGIPLVRMMRKRAQSTPVVITMHGTDVNLWPNRFFWYRDTLREMCAMPWVSFTTHTETYKQKLVALGVAEDRILVIPNSFHADFTPPSDLEMRFEPGGLFRVVSVARMDIWKGHEHLIRGFAKFQRETYANSTLTLVGYGHEEHALRKLVTEIGMDEYIHFKGRMAHEKIPAVLRSHHVYVQPSIKHPETLQEEGQPIAVLEAISSGLLVVVTDTGGMAETVRVGPYEDQAFVIEPASADAVAEGLARALARAPAGPVDRRYVAAIAERHSQERQIERTMAHYRDVHRARGNGMRSSRRSST